MFCGNKVRDICFLHYFSLHPDEQADSIPRNTLALSKTVNQINTLISFTGMTLHYVFFFVLAHWYGEPKLAHKKMALNAQKIIFQF